MLSSIRHILIVALLLALAVSVLSQDGMRYHFVGVNPSVTVEPFYERGEFDLNVFPVVYQRSLSRRLDLRLTSIVNLGIRTGGTAFSHVGIETALPIFLKAKETREDLSSGLFIAPIVSLSRNRFDAHNTVGLWLEPGYNLLFENKVAMSFGLQLGGSFFAYDSGQTTWGSHFGVKVIIGKWL